MNWKKEMDDEKPRTSQREIRKEKVERGRVAKEENRRRR